jgi:hypothetical protein
VVSCPCRVALSTAVDNNNNNNNNRGIRFMDFRGGEEENKVVFKRGEEGDKVVSSY